jgi:alkanesulfonate monooxygenase SsuD/methylene tetrahydromethanopterin reductase-like flavin-dependent oxidoreductase (luciferase family)
MKSFSNEVLLSLAAAATKTSTINLGTSIVPTYPHHPLVLAQQAMALNYIAPGRLRLGISPESSDPRLHEKANVRHLTGRPREP